MSQAIELPRPHGEGPPVPPMWQADLSAEMLAPLFADLSASAEVVSVRGRCARRENSTEPLTLADAHACLVSGAFAGVQLRYRFDGQEWIDTLLRLAGAFRLVRCQVPPA